MSEFGSFTAWLKDSGLKFIPLKLTNCKELGTLQAFEKETLNRCRPYNHIEFKADKVIKTALTPEGQKLLDKEIAWYKAIEKYGFKAIAKVYSYKPLTMSRIDGTNIFLANLSQGEKIKTIKSLFKHLNTLHSYQTQSADKMDLVNEYFTKTIDRLNSISLVLPFAEREFIKINGKICKNPLKFQLNFKKLVETKLMQTKFCPIHGDLTLTNTMIDKDANIYFIDARGYFGKQEILGDIRYDFAKLYYSICGNFDNFNIKKFTLQILNDEINFSIKSNGWEFLADELLKGVKSDEIRLIHSIIWLSLASHCWEDYDSMCLAFYNGVLLLDEFLKDF